MITRTDINVIDALNDRYNWDRKILVGGFDVECIRWNKIVHIQSVRRIPKIHKDGRVTIRAFNGDYPIKATKCTLDSTGQSWVSYDVI